MSAPENDDQMWSRPGDEAEDQPRVVANQLRALQREVRDGFESMGRALTMFEKIDAKLDVIIDRQNVADRRLDAIEREQSRTDARLIALEYAAKRRKKVK